MKHWAWFFMAFFLPALSLADEAALSPAARCARDAVLRQLGSASDGATLEVVSASRAEHDAPGAGYRAHPVEGRFPRARFTVMVDVLRDGRVIASRPVGFALSERGPSLVYRHADRAGAPAEHIDVDTASIDQARAVGALRDLAAEAGMRLRRTVRAGDPVLASDFEPVPDVDNRSVVRLQATYGAITVETPATAMRSGNRGDSVPVMVQGASGPVTARVIDRGVARIEQ